MPKEYVLASFVQPFTTTEVSENNFVVTQPVAFRAQVSWGANEYVQIATVDPQANEFNNGFYVDLDRKGINDLIRLLRKARDRAYGRDE